MSGDPQAWWLRQLDADHPDWPEWDQLREKVAAATEFNVESADPTGDVGLLTCQSGELELRRRVPRQLLWARYEEPHPRLHPESTVPHWASALWGLDCDRMGSGVLGKLQEEERFANPLEAPTLEDWMKTGAAYLGLLPAEEIQLPDRTVWPLQTNRTGAMLWMDADRNIWAFDSAHKGLIEIGSLADTARMCVHAIVQGEDWYVSELQERPEHWGLKAASKES